MSVRLYENGELKEVANVGGGSDFEKVICDESEKEQLAEQGIIKDGMIVFTTGGDNNVKIEVDEELNAESTNPVENRAINQAINEVKQSIPDVTPIQTVITQLQEAISQANTVLASLKQVATTGSYNDLTDKPTIPNASDFLSKNGDTTTGNFTFGNVSVSSLNSSGGVNGASLSIKGLGYFNDKIRVIGSKNEAYHEQYHMGGIEVLEQLNVGNAQSENVYAPTVGFHWMNRTGQFLSLCSDSQFHFFQQNGTGVATVNANIKGTVSATSDARDKIDIKDEELGLDFINRLRPRQFRYNYREDYKENLLTEKAKPVINEEPIENKGQFAHERYHNGLVAQELKEVMDSLGIDFAGYQDEKVEGVKDSLYINYIELIGPMIKAIQELSQKVKVLEGSE